MSDPHTFASAILISIAPGSGSGTGYSRISKGLPVPWNTASFAVSAMSLVLLIGRGVATGPLGPTGARTAYPITRPCGKDRPAARPALVAHHDAAVHVDGLPRHVVRVGPGEKRDDARDGLGPLRSSQRNVPDPALPRLALPQSLEGSPLPVDLLPHRRLHRPRADAIRCDPLRRQHLGRRAREAHDAGLRGRVGRHEMVAAAVRCDRRGLYELAAQLGL